MIYFASDIHLGAPYISDHRAHEARIVSWLQMVRSDATDIYFLGDVFDYWFEYTSVVPRGHVRFLGKVAEMADQGIRFHFFTGNHDVWMFSYLQQELGATVHTGEMEFTAGGKRFLVGHGDNLGYHKFYSLMMWCFHSKVLQAIYRWLHPDMANLIATTWSHSSRKANNKRIDELENRQPEDEDQLKYARKKMSQGCMADYYIFGHRHRVLDHPVGDANGPRLLIIGDWIRHYSYAAYDGHDVVIKTFSH